MVSKLQKEQLKMKNKNKINEAMTQTHSRNNGTHRTHFTHLVTFPKAAFTLAEVLITLAIIGVVAAITIPSLVKNYNEKAWSTAKDVFEKRLEVAAKQLNTEEKLAGYSSTIDFVNELKNKIKITKICNSNELTKCFAKTITTANNIVYDTETDLAQLTEEDWGTGTVGVQFANGVNALISYNPNTTQDPYNNQFAASAESMAIIYDVSGYKNPNALGKDINVNANVKPLDCLIKSDLVGGMCITKILGPNTGYSALTPIECAEAKNDGEIDVDACYNGNDYFAGAVKACGGIDNMPTMAQLGELATYVLGELATYVYNHDSTIGAQQDISSGLTLDTTKASQFLSVSPGQSSGWFYVWSGQENSSGYAYLRYFGSTATLWYNHGRNLSDILAVCVDN